jgi:hypothetical protein
MSDTAMVTMRAIASTQIHENYGAHSWDGTGECPQYWKAKGGTDYLVAEITLPASEAGRLCWKPLETIISESIERKDDYYEEYVIGFEVLGPEKWDAYVKEQKEFYCSYPGEEDNDPLEYLDRSKLQEGNALLELTPKPQEYSNNPFENL